MGTSRTVAVVGLRTAASAGWRADASAALAVLRHRPGLWLLGMIGFSLRGGILLLTLPIIVLPTQVEVRLMLGGNIGSTGFTQGFWMLVAGATVATVILALLILYVLARVELASFGRIVRDPASGEHRHWVEPPRLSRGRRRVVIGHLFVVQALGLLLILVGAVPLAAALGDATLAEILRPSSTDPIYLRIASQVTQPLIGWIAIVAVAELLTAVATRAVLIAAHSLSSWRPGQGMRAAWMATFGSVFAHPLRVLGTAVAGWVLFGAALIAGILAVSLAWQATRAVFLSDGSVGGVEQAAVMFAVAIMLGAVFGAALLLSGLVSALRSSLWTLASLR